MRFQWTIEERIDDMNNKIDSHWGFTYLLGSLT